MKTKTLLLSLTTALALSAASVPAWALETEFIATGTVYDSYDYTGVFGPAGASLDGDSFTADFYIDTSKGEDDALAGNYEDIVGGTSYNSTLSPVSAILTINGFSEDFSGSYAGQAYVAGGAYPGEVYTNVFGSNAYSEIYNVIYNIDGNNSGYPTALGEAFSVLADAENTGSGEFQVDVEGAEAQGDLNTTNISSAGVISAAPEPSAWALMITGVDMVGATLRLGRRGGAPAAV